MLAESHTERLDAGPRKGVGTERFCAATGAITPVADMIRFVLGPDGMPVPDLKRRLPGRGIWITGTRAALRTAITRRAFSRSFKRQVAVPDGLVDTTEHLLERAALDALAIAHKAGQAVFGFAKVEAALARDPVAVLLHAKDAADDGVKKLDAAMRRSNRDGIVVCNTFASAQLDLAFGRPNVIHAALLAGPECETFVARLVRLDRFRSGDAKSHPSAGKKR
jgi:predicted RNA-binding protein YlxR (DUF448 family)